MPRKEKNSRTPHSGPEKARLPAGRKSLTPGEAIDILLGHQQAILKAGVIAKNDEMLARDPKILSDFAKGVEEIFKAKKASGSAVFEEKYGVKVADLVADGAEASAKRQEFFGDTGRMHALRSDIYQIVVARRDELRAEATSFRPVKKRIIKEDKKLG